MSRDYCEACGYTDSHDPNCPRPRDAPAQPSAKQDTSPQGSHTGGELCPTCGQSLKHLFKRAQPIPGLPFADLKSAFEKPRRWADQYDFDKSDPPTRLFVAASNWMDRAEHAEAVLRWCVDHEGECLGDHPQLLLKAKEALQI